MIIAIDGVAASGKGTLAALLAKHYNCECLFSGNLYRLCARKLINAGIDIDQFILSPSKKTIAFEKNNSPLVLITCLSIFLIPLYWIVWVFAKNFFSLLGGKFYFKR